MTLSPALDAIRNFDRVVWQTTLPADREPTNDAAIAAALDQLAAAYQHTPERTPGNADWLAPTEDLAALRQQAMRRFPDYGPYAVVDPLGPRTQAPVLANALEDLVHVSCELREVTLRAELFGVADAEWFFRLLHFSWGGRIRKLSLYLHARQFG